MQLGCENTAVANVSEEAKIPSWMLKFRKPTAQTAAENALQRPAWYLANIDSRPCPLAPDWPLQICSDWPETGSSDWLGKPQAC